ncbi:MAG: hypothetical protein COA44_06180 [Arcobacter sp.]|nr:MAG: hypothetical protein COA44_06180 [Arcobacter sp.]
MENPIGVSVSGLEELFSKLKILPEVLAKRVIVGAVRAGASVIWKEAKNNVPVHNAVLLSSLRIVKRKPKNKNLIWFTVTPSSKIIKKGLIALGVEKKVWINKRTGFKSSNYDNYGGYVELGNSKVAPQPYLLPAYENKGEESIKAVEKYMKKRLDREIGKL